MNDREKLDYANWIPVKLLMVSGTVGGILAVLFGLSFLIAGGAVLIVLRVLLAAAAVLFLGLFGYMAHARRLLSYEGGGVQGRILDNVLAYLHWNGEGLLLDIGCGSGAMAVKAAKKYPNARVTGMDYWGAAWDYARSQCEANARLEGVSDRTAFQKGDASKLEFPDAYFDAAVSNFVFHEVRSQPDKLALIREALRVVKPGGAFSFGDVFFSRTHYPDLEALIRELSGDVAELHFVDTRQNDFVPGFLKTPLVAGQMGLIYGLK
ncbi:Methyltransferase domain-containing protein [Sporobacter termitidis DSM 10068]|uniref:Methyltransferase domain-containing protein n=1 Tax=Sporobacter termitidis DSM 10068 TaxID=1123282 RepID=A0A1M5WLP5_9FIRM|nr:class I SAM-dependent methyltransferase [Sporobacter termitidis]SHH88475.1 Methyltransferase domain-containing protein [Sporobacter termitidis DSM 10068]